MDVTQKVPELVVNERMPHGKRVKNQKEKVPGWTIEEMKERPYRSRRKRRKTRMC